MESAELFAIPGESPLFVLVGVIVLALVGATRGCGEPSIASIAQTGKTSMKSIKLSKPEGWKKLIAVDGNPKAII